MGAPRRSSQLWQLEGGAVEIIWVEREGGVLEELMCEMIPVCGSRVGLEGVATLKAELDDQAEAEGDRGLQGFSQYL